MPIRVLLVEDSPLAQVILTRILSSSDWIEVVGIAGNGLEALTMLPELDPQVICTDLHMPHMDGLAMTVEVMARYPRPILVVSASVQDDDAQHIFELLAAGAVDILPKPTAGLSDDDQTLNKMLIDKIRVLAGVKVFRRKPKQRLLPEPSFNLPSASPSTASPATAFSPSLPAKLKKKITIIAIGASTGGPQALCTVFKALPKRCPPVLCVQHISTGFLQGLIDWLQRGCTLSISIAQAGQPPLPGHIYFPKEDCHLAVDRSGLFTYLDSPPVGGHRPSITVTFEAIAQHYGPYAVGVLLTGMGQDGASGLQSIAQAGGLTIAQNEATSVIFGMPKVAIELGAAAHVLPIEAIAPALRQFVQAFDLLS
ncbi:MAG: chemotaxis-specific protein-glutamate methyltransferase CheB [Phormidesmis sp.]